MARFHIQELKDILEDIETKLDALKPYYEGNPKAKKKTDSSIDQIGDQLNELDSNLDDDAAEAESEDEDDEDADDSDDDDEDESD